MTCNHKLAVWLMAVAILVISTSIARSQVTVFADNFEDTTVVPGLPDAPQVGSYPTVAPTIPEAMVVLAGSPHPDSPAGGNNILHTTGKDRNYGMFSSAANGAGIVRLELDARLDASTDNAFGLFGNSSGGITLDSLNMTAWVRTGSDGKVYAYKAAWIDTGLTHTIGQWQHYVLEYVLGTDEFTLTAGGGSPVLLPYLTGTSATQINGVLFGQGGTNSTVGYTDNVVVSFQSSLHPGDANGDGLVNLADLQILGDNWQSSTGSWAAADFTLDGTVNLADLQILGDNWGFGTSTDVSFDEALALAGLAIPEPASLLLLSLLAPALLRRSKPV
ncbi:MAG: hypothetical protein IT445_05965 [Phycisphaeraceae bacterium]|nr:hypothetical protein [Phycisphaeraceae bacterium]